MFATTMSATTRCLSNFHGLHGCRAESQGREAGYLTYGMLAFLLCGCDVWKVPIV